MTHVYDDPASFKEAVLAGFAQAHADRVERVPHASGFVRKGGPLQGKVSLVVGGGSGHYPSYSGVVGSGFADGAVLGDLFASPSAEQVYRVGRAAQGDAGLILAFGNYAGDRLNFGVAADRLRAEGVDVRVVWVTDDVASAAPDEAEKRRGIAGTFTVYKAAGAAAERGDDLDEVERLMRKTNAATYSFGVAFGGCTMPGADKPLFEVEPGRMEFGLGIHGEPGVSSTDWMPADRLATALVERVLAERPADTDGRAAVLLNGLGATKYEELYVLYGEVVRLLRDAGAEPVQPEVGELVTSLDMAGCSLTMTWLDDELAALWEAAADTAAFSRGTGAEADQARFTERAPLVDATEEAPLPDASEKSAASAALVVSCLEAFHTVVEEHKEQLGSIDAVAGDGDHGIGMSRGATAALEAARATPQQAGVRTLLVRTGAAFGDRAGGTSGILWGLLLDALGQSLGDQDEVTAQRLADAVAAAVARLREFSEAEPGDKTMLDALLPFRDTLAEAVAGGDGLAASWRKAAEVATRTAEETAPLRPKLGRARPLAERSVGTPDPGAVSLGLIVTAVADVLDAARSKRSTP